MTTITLSMPNELKKQMDEFGEINWSAVAREAIKINFLSSCCSNQLFQSQN